MTKAGSQRTTSLAPSVGTKPSSARNAKTRRAVLLIVLLAVGWTRHDTFTPVGVNAFSSRTNFHSKFHLLMHADTTRAWFLPGRTATAATSSKYRKRRGPHRTEHVVPQVQLAAASQEAMSSGGNDDTTTQPPTRYHWTRQNLAIALPALIGMMADPLLSLIDTAYVGRVGTCELAALGACTSIFHLAFNAFRATTTATTSLVATSLQQDSPEITQQVTRISVRLGVLIGLVVMTALQLGGQWCLTTMGVPPTSPMYIPAQQYLSMRAWAAPVVLGIVVSEGAFRGYGDTRIPLLASAAASLINLVLDPILMFPLGLGVTGAAAATALSQVGAAGVYGWFLTKRHMLGGGTLPKPVLPPPMDNRSNNEVNVDGGTTSTANEIKVTATQNAASVARITPPLSDWVSDESVQAFDSEQLHLQSLASIKDGHVQQRQIIRTILGANLSMMTKQGSLLLAWAYATARATRIGANHVAAHQVALSCWLVLALILDGAAVSAQVLMSRAIAQKDDLKKRKEQVRSLIGYFVKFAAVQGVTACLLWMGLLGRYIVPHLFTSDPIIRMHLVSLMPHLAWMQILVSLTLVIESLAIGGHQFKIMALGTTISTVMAMSQLQHATNIVSIWARGINTLFAGRLLTAIVATLRVSRLASKPPPNKSTR